MLVEGRIETTNFQENFVLQVTFGLDTAVDASTAGFATYA